jgi:TRAP-type C4-dicarboxylate transport system permease small subunit
MKFLKAIDGYLNKAEGMLLIVMLTVMIVLAFAQVVLRNVFSAGFLWADILLRHLVLWIGFLGGALGVSHKRHINVDAFTHYMSPKVLSATSVVTNLFAAGICVWLSNAAIRFLEAEMSVRSYVYGEIPSWYAELIIPVGFALFVFHFLVRAVTALEEFRKKESMA